MHAIRDVRTRSAAQGQTSAHKVCLADSIRYIRWDRRGRRPCPAAPTTTVVHIIQGLRSRRACGFKAAIADAFCRSLGGDLSLVPPVTANVQNGPNGRTGYQRHRKKADTLLAQPTGSARH
eukprot:4158112-Pleurochrysis_carterae.AAC.1